MCIRDSVTAIVPVGSIDISDTATGTILDNDTAAITVDNAIANEDGTLTFTATLDNEVHGGLTVDAAFINLNATDNDYTNTPQTLSFSGTAGEAVQFTVPVNDDSIVEAAESFAVRLDNLVTAIVPVGSIDITDTATGTIIDNDTAAITITNAVAIENGVLTFTATLDQAVDGGLSIDVVFTDGTAAGANTDYNNATQTLFFNGDAGETNQFAVTLTDDQIVESAEFLQVAIDNLTTTTVSTFAIDTSATAFGTILDNDNAVASIIATDPFAAETTAGQPANDGQFIVILSNESSTDTVVSYNLSGTANPLGNTPSGDINAASGTVTILAGQVAAIIDVPVVDDLLVEGTEQVVATLTNIAVGDPQITVDTNNNADQVTITDNDGPALWEITGPAVTDEGTLPPYVLTLSQPLGQGVVAQVAINLTDLTTNANDHQTLQSAIAAAVANRSDLTYDANTSVLTYVAPTDGGNFTPLAINLVIANDNFTEGPESFLISLSNAGSPSDALVGLGTNRLVETLINDTQGPGGPIDGPSESVSYTHLTLPTICSV